MQSYPRPAGCGGVRAVSVAAGGGRGRVHEARGPRRTPIGLFNSFSLGALSGCVRALIMAAGEHSHN